MTTFYPSMHYRDAQAAIDWLERAFGFERRVVYEDGDAVGHAELAFGDGLVMMGTAREGHGGDRVGQGWVYVAVDDADAHCAQAREAGAEIVTDLHDTDYGSRDYAARDLEGNLWNFGTYRPEGP